MQLWQRLTLAMGLLAVIPLVVVGLSAMEVATEREQHASQEGLNREARLQADLVGRWLSDQAPLVLAFTQLYPGRLQELSREAQAQFPRLVYRLTPTAVTVVLVDGDGLPVVDPVFRTRPSQERSAADAERAQELVARLPLTAALQTPDIVHVGSAWLPYPGARPSVPVAVLAATGEDASEQRVLGVELELMIADSLLSLVTDEHAVALVDDTGTALVGGGHALLTPERLRPILTTGESAFILDTPLGEIRGSVVGVPDYPTWSVVVAERADVVLAPAYQIRRRLLPQIAVAGVCAVGIALVVASSLSRPVERLRDVALQVADGHVGVLAAVRRSDEIGELGRAFDHMSRQLAVQQSQIEAFNAELQQRVDDRTRELRAAQEELVRSGQLAAVAELGAGLAHELNNPLAAVLGLAQLLKNRHPTEPMLADLETQADRCREVVATMVRVQTLEVDPAAGAVVELGDVLHQVTELVGGSFRQRGVHVAVSTTDPTLRVRVDPGHASRVLAQLLNAMRSGLEAGATVVIRGTSLDGNVLVHLTPDRPVGAHPDRRDDWLASAHGLWVARQLLDRMGGRLDEGPDSAWVVSLPGA